MKALMAATAAWMLMGCGARVGGAGSAAQGTSDSAPAAPERGGTEDGSVAKVGPSDASSTGDRASPTPDLARGATVWVGQSDQTVTFPAGYDGGTVVPYNRSLLSPSGPEKVVLIQDAQTSPLIGTITFGDVGPPPPATDPKEPYPPAPTMLHFTNGQTLPIVPDNWLTLPFPGFSYSLVASTLSGNLLSLGFTPSQLWQGWCALQDSSPEDASVSSAYDLSPCACDGGSCSVASSSPVRNLTLTVSGDTMQGQLLGGIQSAGGPVEIRLQRIQ